MAGLTAWWDHDGEVLVIGGDMEAMTLLKEAMKARFSSRDPRSTDVHAHATFYMEDNDRRQIVGITDCKDDCVETRDGEEPAAILRLFPCK
jgi:hypothetical protein